MVGTRLAARHRAALAVTAAGLAALTAVAVAAGPAGATAHPRRPATAKAASANAARVGAAPAAAAKAPARVAAGRAAPAALPANRGLAVVADPAHPGALDLFVLDSAGRIFESIEQVDGSGAETGWSPWSQLDGLLTSIAVAPTAAGQLVIVGTNSAGTIVTRIQTAIGSSTWTPWSVLDGSLSRVSLVRDDRLQQLVLVGVNSSDQIFTRYQSGVTVAPATWSRWVQLDGLLTDVAAVWTTEALAVTLVGVNSAGTIVTRTQTDVGAPGWTPWSVLDGSLSRVALTGGYFSAGDNRAVLVGVNADQTVFTRAKEPFLAGVWSPWTQFDGVLTQVAAAAPAPLSFTGVGPAVHVIGINAGGTVWERSQVAWNSPDWNPWHRVNTPLA